MAFPRRWTLALLPCFAAAAPVDEAVCPGAAPVPTCTGPTSGHEYLAWLSNVGQYDRSKRPPCGNATFAGPTVVEVQLYLTQVNQVDQKLGQVTVNGYLRSWWQDPRLAFNPPASGGCLDEVVLEGEDIKRVWQPDLYIDNLVEIERDGASLVEISPDGSVWKSEQLTLQVKSSINLGKLPFDSQTCKIVVASYAQSTKRMRVLPRGGAIGEGRSGAGIVAPHMTSSVWSFGQGGDDEPGPDGFETAGRVETRSSWDYLTLEFEYSRKPKYYEDQVLLPSVLFLIVSYIQFFVDPAAAPARAALAVIPVLIMRTMSNSVYSSLPQGSQRMWLSDYVSATMFLSVFAACQFGVVQYCQLNEKRKAAKLVGLQKAKQVAEKLFSACKNERLTLLEVVSKCAASTASDDQGAADSAHVQLKVGPTAECQTGDSMVQSNPATPMGAFRRNSSRAAGEASPRSEPSAAPPRPRRVKSQLSVKYNMSEADLLFIKYAEKIFERFDRDGSGYCHASEVRRALTYFNIYLSTECMASLMCMFLRDEGEATPENEMEVALTFDQFTLLLSRVEHYTVHAKSHSKAWVSVVARIQGMPPSRRCDFLARWCFPVVVALMNIAFLSLLPLY